MTQLDVQDLGFDQGAALLVRRALRVLASGESFGVSWTDLDLLVHVRGWCRAEGHGFQVWPGLSGPPRPAPPIVTVTEADPLAIRTV
jgi:hypothetical protein